ncbi:MULTISPECIES: hypothetical protein [unclassified Thermosynechococcus]|uniref:hypothetical protein n=1 Tax=unclassified Thermosynechococcus TaxID=2622553 RepID=UPI0026738FFA|nr:MULTISPECIES: hypothetical protein [unclassified Thermosynechococcus]WKT83873.1 hypothetical protein QYC28_00755 [Thermosynechococcus sp. HY596]WNC63004.1 hypothetical protein RHK13_00755 [Thermosynechococcus sp. HY591]WNC65564.1 hypothetical protein RHK28_00760 [Thermosynechococcus sp. HY593]
MSDSRLLDIARQGDPRAIGTLLNAVLLPKRVKATVVRQAEELMITLHSEKMLNQGAAVTLIRTALEKLHLPAIQRVFIESRVLGVPLWESHFQLQVLPPTQPHRDVVEDPWGTETAATEPSPPEPTLLDLMSAFMTSEAPAISESQDVVARSPEEKEHPIPVESTPEYGDVAFPLEQVTENGTGAEPISEPQESFLDEIPEIDPDEDISLADLAAAFDPNPPSPEPNTDRGESPFESPPLQEERIESDTLAGFSGELPVFEVAAEPPPEASESIEESIATPEAQDSIAEIPEPAAEFSEAALDQLTLEAYDFPEPTTEDIAALEAEVRPPTAITPEMIAKAESSPEGAIAPDAAPVVEDPWAVSDTLPTAPPVPSESSALPQDQEAANYPPLRDPWLEAEPVPQVKADETPPPETATEPPLPPSESEIYTIPTIEKVPRDHQSKVAGLAGIVMGLGFCATGLGTIIGLPMVVGSMWMLGDEEVWSGECPHCHHPLKVPVGKLWRFSCEKCQGLIEMKNGRFYARQTPPAPPSS